MHFFYLKNGFSISDKMLLVLFLVFLHSKKSIPSSIDSCFAANSINLTQYNSSNLVLPIDCQCTDTDLVCINLKIFSNNPTQSQLEFPNLFLLFEQDNTSINYIMPKNRFSFYGYPALIPSAFKGVKLVSDPTNTNLLANISFFIDFRESVNYPSGIFDNFGNLELINRDRWPKLYITISNTELSPLILSSNSFDNLNIEHFSLKYAGQTNYLSTSFLNASKLKTLEIKNTNAFAGFAESSKSLNIQVSNLIIDDCINLQLTNKTMPAFISLVSLTIKASGLKLIPNNIWTKFTSLASLSLIGNQLKEFDSSSLIGLENKLLYLDLSSNQIENINWSAFYNFNHMKTINLSYNNLTAINTSRRIWPNSNELENVILKGYSFDDTSICDFYQELNLSRTLVNIDLLHPCNCFVFFIYKDYRLNPSKRSSLMQDGIPICYQNLINDTNQVKFKEDNCNFPAILQKTSCAAFFSTTTLSTATGLTLTSFINTSKASISVSTSTSNNSTSTSLLTTAFTTTTTTLTTFTPSVTTTTTNIITSKIDTTNTISSGSSRILTTTPCLQSTTTSPGLTTISIILNSFI